MNRFLLSVLVFSLISCTARKKEKSNEATILVKLEPSSDGQNLSFSDKKVYLSETCIGLQVQAIQLNGEESVPASLVSPLKVEIKPSSLHEGEEFVAIMDFYEDKNCAARLDDGFSLPAAVAPEISKTQIFFKSLSVGRGAATFGVKGDGFSTSAFFLPEFAYLSKVLPHDFNSVKRITLPIGMASSRDKVQMLRSSDHPDNQEDTELFGFASGSSLIRNSKNEMEVSETVDIITKCRTNANYCGVLRPSNSQSFTDLTLENFKNELDSSSTFKSSSEFSDHLVEEERIKAQIFEKNSLWYVRTILRAYNEKKEHQEWLVTVGVKIVKLDVQSKKVEFEYKFIESVKKP